jgi:hypothetical protein
MGAKYQPSIKDQKATLRFHTNTKREQAKAAGESLFVPPRTPRSIPVKAAAPGHAVSASKPPAPTKR